MEKLKANKSLLEAYKNRLAISEAVYNKRGLDTMDDTKKLIMAQLLKNISKGFALNESFGSSTGTQLADMGTYKKFCLDITTIAVPNLIAHELVMVYPMTSMTGYVRYLKFVAGSAKGGVAQGTLFNDPFRLGQMTESRMNYTGSAVVESISPAATEFVPAWTPVVGGKVIGVAADGTETELVLVDGKVTFVAGTYAKIKYVYDNAIIPQNDLPILNAEMAGIALEAKPRRIAIYYSQLAAFQVKAEAGLDLGELLKTQAVAELNYEIDSEVVGLLDKTAGVAVADTTFNKTVPYGISKSQHYEAFAEVLENASRIIYDRTQKHAANYVVISSSIKPMLPLMKGWKAASSSKINGPYFAGELNGLKVFVSPAVAAGRFFVGFNGNDLATSAAVWAPFMPVTPTQLLGYADGGMSQGFASLYDLKILNPELVVAGQVVEEERVVLTQTVSDSE